jgi:multidrug/hemolysin transport system permease protein
MATTCITLTFCGNTIVVSDRINGSIEDIKAAPVSRVNIFLAYFAANFLSTFLVALIALGIGFIYIAIVGWYLSFVDVLMLIVCSAFLTLFGSLFASIVMSFVKSQGVLTTCSIVVSALYGFICGAYMPISSFGKGLANVIYCLPGTYGTMTLRHYFCHGVLDKLEENLVGQIGSEKASMATQSIAKGFDIKIEAFGNTISVSNAMLILIFSALGMLLLYSLIVFLENKKKAPKTGALKRD